MRIPLRRLRQQYENRNGPTPRSARELDRMARILREAEATFIENGYANITLRDIAETTGIAPSTIRRVFADTESILGEILLRHLKHVSDAMAEIPATAPDAAAQRRAAYIAATRRPLGGLTAAHELFTLHRHSLPQDVLAPLNEWHATLGAILAGPLAARALVLLDHPAFSAADIEATLAALTGPEATKATAPKPAPPPTEPLRIPPSTPKKLEILRAKLMSSALMALSDSDRAKFALERTSSPALRERKGPNAQHWEGEGAHPRPP